MKIASCVDIHVGSGMDVVAFALRHSFKSKTLRRETGELLVMNLFFYLGTIATIVVTAKLVSRYLEIRSQELSTPIKLELQVLGSD